MALHPPNLEGLLEGALAGHQPPIPPVPQDPPTAEDVVNAEQLHDDMKTLKRSLPQIQSEYLVETKRCKNNVAAAHQGQPANLQEVAALLMQIQQQMQQMLRNQQQIRQQMQRNQQRNERQMQRMQMQIRSEIRNAEIRSFNRTYDATGNWRALIGEDGNPIPNFPGTKRALLAMNTAQCNALMQHLGLPIEGNLNEKRIAIEEAIIAF